LVEESFDSCVPIVSLIWNGSELQRTFVYGVQNGEAKESLQQRVRRTVIGSFMGIWGHISRNISFRPCGEQHDQTPQICRLWVTRGAVARSKKTIRSNEKKAIDG
jgi:hypothetical protein